MVGKQDYIVYDWSARNLLEKYKNTLKISADMTRLLSEWGAGGSEYSSLNVRSRAGSTSGTAW